ncbi:MAG: hypothetical protein FJ148_18510 [Deltaproteobacteria bacterium]|nr:hypothetical protein [Deltaproteobacteria bacterium]
MTARRRRALGGAALFLAGWACGGGGTSAVSAAMQLVEIGGASLADMLRQAGPPAIAPGFGVAEIVPDDGARHFAVTVASENRASREDTAALYALMDGHGAIGGVWGANVLAFAHSDMTSGAVQGIEVDVGNLGTDAGVPVTGVNVFAMGPRPSDVALGILNAADPAGPGGFREGIAFRSNAPGVAVTEALIRVHPGFGTVATGIDLRGASFAGPALATPGFEVRPDGAVASRALATGAPAFACVDAAGRLFASATPCTPLAAGG